MFSADISDMKPQLIIVGLLLFGLSANAQKVSLSTNLLGYAELGTINMDVSCALSRRWSIVAGARYNPFIFRKGDLHKQFQHKQQSYSLGVRVWPWHIWSGWWLSSRIRYQEYNSGGLFTRETQEGDRLGLGLYGGYTYMVSRHFNIEFGLGLWGGVDMYRRYSCPACGLVVGEGTGGFILPDDLMFSLVYVF